MNDAREYDNDNVLEKPKKPKKDPWICEREKCQNAKIDDHHCVTHRLTTMSPTSRWAEVDAKTGQLY